MPRLRSISMATVLFLLGCVCFPSSGVTVKSAAGAEPKSDNAVFTERKLAHMVFFTLKESNDENRKKLVDAAQEYLGGHPGEIYFSVGTMVNLKEAVSVTDFDVALHIVFSGKEAHDKYLVSERHLKFIAAAKPLWKKVQVFDSALEPDAPAAKEAK